MRGSENVLISDQNSSAVLILFAMKQGGHPGPLTGIGWIPTHNTGLFFYQFTTA
jgi:hypothetical protein